MNHLFTREQLRPPAEVRFAADSEIMRSYTGLAVAAAEGIDDVNRLTGRTTAFDEAFADQSNALTAIADGFKTHRGQVSLEPLLDFMINTGFADPEKPSYLLLSDDLVAENTNFVFGITLESAGLSIQSIQRFVESQRNQHTLAQVTKLIARHEYGHLLGLGAKTIRKQDSRGGLYQGHCINPCTMQQVMSVDSAVSLARSRDGTANAGFCDDCTNYLGHLSSQARTD